MPNGRSKTINKKSGSPSRCVCARKSAVRIARMPLLHLGDENVSVGRGAKQWQFGQTFGKFFTVNPGGTSILASGGRGRQHRPIASGLRGERGRQIGHFEMMFHARRWRVFQSFGSFLPGGAHRRRLRISASIWRLQEFSTR